MGARLAIVVLGLTSCMLGNQYFNTQAVTKRSADEYSDMNPLGISGCKAKRAEAGAPKFTIHCRCGGGGSTEGCLDKERAVVNKGFDDYAQRVCRTEGFQGVDVESREEPAVPSSDEGEPSKAVIVTGLVRCR